MPPRVREVVAMLESMGFRLLRRGKGDHSLYVRGTDTEVIDGGPNHEMSKGLWEKLRKKYGLRRK
jgi:predicted RNA binding protein YcfA (HicA-like mRNA interferase family)